MNHIQTSKINMKRTACQYNENVSNEGESTANSLNVAYRRHIQMKPIHSAAVAV
jgi:hypothetical protein